MRDGAAFAASAWWRGSVFNTLRGEVAERGSEYQRENLLMMRGATNTSWKSTLNHVLTGVEAGYITGANLTVNGSTNA
jgi:hypothetical protein